MGRIPHFSHQNPPRTHAHFSCLDSSPKCLKSPQTQVLHVCSDLVPSNISNALCLQSSSSSPSFPSFLDNSLRQAHQHPSESPLSEVRNKTFLLSSPICVLSFIQPNFFKAMYYRHQSFSMLAPWSKPPVFLLFSHNKRVIIKTCLTPFNDFSIAWKIKLKPLTWPTKPYKTSPCLPLGPSLLFHCSVILPPSLRTLSSYLPQGLCLHNFCLECSPPWSWEDQGWLIFPFSFKPQA